MSRRSRSAVIRSSATMWCPAWPWVWPVIWTRIRPRKPSGYSTPERATKAWLPTTSWTHLAWTTPNWSSKRSPRRTVAGTNASPTRRTSDISKATDTFWQFDVSIGSFGTFNASVKTFDGLITRVSLRESPNENFVAVLYGSRVHRASSTIDDVWCLHNRHSNSQRHNSEPVEQKNFLFSYYTHLISSHQQQLTPIPHHLTADRAARPMATINHPARIACDRLANDRRAKVIAISTTTTTINSRARRAMRPAVRRTRTSAYRSH